jgi:4-amino-4-deoxy-L-arabinose transferase-like glycosyltransferase
MHFFKSGGSRQKLYELSLLALALVLAVIGQVELMVPNVSSGLAAYAAAGVVFCLAVRSGSPKSPAVPYQVRGSFLHLSPLIWLAIILALLIVSMIPYPNPGPNERWETLLGWLLSILLFSLGVLQSTAWCPPSWSELKAQIRTHKMEIIGVAALCLAALVIRTVDLEAHPYAFANDEGWVGVEGRNLLQGAFSNFFRVGYGSQPVLTFAPTSLSITLFGQTIFAVRFVSALEGMLTVLFLYLAGREIFGRRVAFLAAIILAAMPVHVHFSRTGYSNIITGFYAALLVWLVFRALRRGKISSFLWAGLATGSAIYTYLGSRLGMLLAVGILGYVCLTQRRFLRQHWNHLLVFVAAALIVAAPQISFFISKPDTFMARVSTEGILQNGWLADQAATGGTPAIIKALGDQLANSSLVYISAPAPYGFYASPDPYFPPFAAIFMVLGMGYAFMRFRRPGYVTLLAWFWSVTILGGMLTASPPASQRLIMGFPAAALMVAIGLDQAVALLERQRFFPSRLVSLRLGAVTRFLAVIGIALSGLSFYFFEYRQNGYYGDATNELIYESTRLVTELGPTYQYTLLTAPLVILNFANYNFFIPDYKKIEILQSDNLASMIPSPISPTLYVAIPERQRELQLIANAIPGGKWLEFRRQTRPDQILFLAYIYPPAEVTLPGPFQDTPQMIQKDIAAHPVSYLVLIVFTAMGLNFWLLPTIRKHWPREK